METTETPRTPIEVLSKAIRRRSVVSFVYDGSEPLVMEPIVLGIHKETGKHVLRCYKSYPPLPNDKKENWFLCELDKISNLKITPMRSKSFRKGSTVIEGDMSEVIEASEDYVKL